MKKAVLLGDSIRLGYGPETAELLKGEFEVFQPDDNSRFCQYMLRQIFDYKSCLEQADVIHFNCGHWDLCELFGDEPFTPQGEYARVMKKIGSMLLGFTDKVIFATTTPVRNDNAYNSNERVKEYNELIVPELKKMGIVINDLNSLLAGDIEKFIREDDKIHLTDEGIKLCSRQTAGYIKNL